MEEGAVSRSRKHGTLLLVAGQVVGQVSMLAVVPLLTRAYGPSILGLYQVAMAIATTAQPAATLRAEFVLPAFTHDANARTLMRRASAAAVFASGGLAIAAGVAFVADVKDAPSVLLMTALILSALALTVLDNAVLIRRGARERLAVRNALAGVVTAALQCGVLAAGLPVVYLAAALLLGRLLAVLCTRRRDDRWRESLAPAERYPYTWHRASFAIASGVSASATGQAIVVAAGPLFGSGASGYVGVAQRIAGTPIGLLGQGLSQALQSHSAPLIRERRPGLHAQVRRQIVVLAAVSLLISASLIALAPPLAAPILGAGWEPAGTVTAILAIPISFQLLAGPLMPLLPMLGQERLLFILQVTRLAVAVLSIAIASALTGDLLWTAAGYGAGVVAGYALLIFVLLQQARRFDREVEV
ncbi:lipopolysaccharide biosynthesis protein [Microbacterium hominis]|uniref:lipopolysaccharide biosynthesis protein n=1 Tax=Microbacterium hominis TaxID=162426 RepID=UPI001963F691|nr:lipopolysaccharide biosynthesis protein [Microbacterium hominis]QRY41914.1 lipopolysaccharide biosynthesis protein [Microbacterium hominis]